MQGFDEDVRRFFEDGKREVEDRMREAGEAAVQYNIENGDYRNRTGHLRRSNFYRVTDDGLEVGNSADYAENVESKGYMVCSGGALLAERILNGDERN